MAKVKVMMSFIDIHTMKNHPVGEVFEATEERIAEIKSVNPDLIQVLPERKRKKVGEE
jgi:hypothetical protein